MIIVIYSLEGEKMKRKKANFSQGWRLSINLKDALDASGIWKGRRLKERLASYT